MIATVMMLGVPCHRVLGNRQPLRSQIGSLHPCRHRSSRRHAFQSLPQTARRSTAAAAAPKPASIEDLAARDQLLDTLLDSKSQEELGKVVADNVLTFDQSFWMRLALRHDQATTEEQKTQLSTLASTVARLVEAIVNASETQTAQSAQLLQQILASAANESGEWHWPLPEAQAASFEQAILDNLASLDEALLSNAFAWMRRCKDDGLTEVYLVLQLVLQRYAAKSLVKDSSKPAEVCLNSVIAAEPQTWTETFRQRAAQDDLNESAVTEALQRRMENVVLSVQSGSHTQRVQAEFLKEVEASMKKAFKGSK